MKTNVINNNPFVIDCFDGNLEIIGKSQTSVVFRLSGSSVSDLMRDHPAFCKNCIFAEELCPREKRILFFEYSLKQELRNPRKLLKSVRNKLVQAGFRNQQKDDKEFNEMYSMTGRQEHQMYQ